MSKSHRILAAAATFSVLSIGGSAALAGELSEPKDLKDSQCKDVMILSGEDREIAIAICPWLHAGKEKYDPVRTSGTGRCHRQVYGLLP
jgi:hypothetical protein